MYGNLYTNPPKNIYVFLIAAYVFFRLEGHMHCANHGNCWTKSSTRLKHAFVAPVFTRQYMFPTMGRRMVSTEQRRTRVERCRTCAFASSLTCSVFCKASSVSSRAACFKRDSPSASTRLQGQGSGFIHLSMESSTYPWKVTRDRLQSLYLVIQRQYKLLNPGKIELFNPLSA